MTLHNGNGDSWFRFTWLIIALLLQQLLWKSILPNDFVEVYPELYVQSECLVFMLFDHYLLVVSCSIQHYLVEPPLQAYCLVSTFQIEHMLSPPNHFFDAEIWDLVTSPFINLYMPISSWNSFFSIFRFYCWDIRIDSSTIDLNLFAATWVSSFLCPEVNWIMLDTST